MKGHVSRVVKTLIKLIMMVLVLMNVQLEQKSYIRLKIFV